MNVQFAGVGESSYLVRRVYVQGVLEPPARDALVDFSSGGHARLAEEYVPVALDAPTAVVARPRRAREGAVVVAFERRRQLRLRHPEVNVRAPGRLFNEAKRSLEELAAPPPNRHSGSGCGAFGHNWCWYCDRARPRRLCGRIRSGVIGGLQAHRLQRIQRLLSYWVERTRRESLRCCAGRKSRGSRWRGGTGRCWQAT